MLKVEDEKKQESYGEGRKDGYGVKGEAAEKKAGQQAEPEEGKEENSSFE